MIVTTCIRSKSCYNVSTLFSLYSLNASACVTFAAEFAGATSQGHDRHPWRVDTALTGHSQRLSVSIRTMFSDISPPSLQNVLCHTGPGNPGQKRSESTFSEPGDYREAGSLGTSLPEKQLRVGKNNELCVLLTARSTSPPPAAQRP